MIAINPFQSQCAMTYLICTIVCWRHQQDIQYYGGWYKVGKTNISGEIMKNYEINNFRSKSICDMHIHSHVEMPLNETLDIYKKIMQHFNYEKIVLEALPYYDITENFKVLYLKSKLDGIYANIGLTHSFNEKDTQEGYLEQIKLFYDMGCDGIKMFEGKPEYRKKLGRPLNDKIFDKFYAFAEEKGLPIVMHVSDPREFWDKERIPQWALERGWFYGEEFVPFETVQKEIEGVLKKFPKLKLIFAHFFFVSDDISYADWIMNKWENTCFDLTPGTEMYNNFSDNIDEWRNFFKRNSSRILFGTDIYNWEKGDNTIEERYAHAVNLVRNFLERKEPFIDKWQNKKIENPFGFEDEILDNIYYNNFVRIFGKQRREIDCDLIKSECKRFIKNHNLNELETANMQKIIDSFR